MAAKGLSERTGIKQKVIDEMIALARRYEVEKLILFGSRARGDYRERSDIDLAFRGGKGDYFTLDVDETTSTLLEFDIINLDKPVRSELLESIERGSGDTDCYGARHATAEGKRDCGGEPVPAAAG